MKKSKEKRKSLDSNDDYVASLMGKLEHTLDEARKLNRRAEILLEEEKTNKARTSIRGSS